MAQTAFAGMLSYLGCRPEALAIGRRLHRLANPVSAVAEFLHHYRAEFA